MAVESVKAKVYTLILERCTVVVDETGAEQRDQRIVTETALYDALRYMDAAYMPGLAALVDIKFDESAAFVRSIKHGSPGFVYVGKGIGLIRLYAAIPAHAGAAQLIGLV